MDRRQLVIPDFQPAGLPDPRQGPFDDPADLAQATAVGRPLSRQVVLDAPLLEALSIPRRAVLPVAVQGLRLPPRAAAPPPDRRDVVYQVHRLERLVAVGRGDAQGQRRALAIDEQVPLGAFFGPIRGVLAGEDPPKTARKLWLSTQQCSQSMPSSCPTRCSRACNSFFQTPRRCQCRSRRQQVMPEPQPISRGSISQGMPLRRTKTMPVRQARSSTGGRPRRPGRARWRGSSGWTTSHSSSGTRGRVMAHLPSATIATGSHTARHFC